MHMAPRNLPHMNYLANVPTTPFENLDSICAVELLDWLQLSYSWNPSTTTVGFVYSNARSSIFFGILGSCTYRMWMTRWIRIVADASTSAAWELTAMPTRKGPNQFGMISYDLSFKVKPISLNSLSRQVDRWTSSPTLNSCGSRFRSGHRFYVIWASAKLLKLMIRFLDIGCWLSAFPIC